MTDALSPRSPPLRLHRIAVRTVTMAPNSRRLPPMWPVNGSRAFRSETVGSCRVALHHWFGVDREVGCAPQREKLPSLLQLARPMLSGPRLGELGYRTFIERRSRRHIRCSLPLTLRHLRDPLFFLPALGLT